MSQITLYLDDSTQALVDQAAVASGMSKSRWVAEAIRQYAQDTWPQAVLTLAGQFPNFPLRPASGSEPAVPDLRRLGF